ncbi:hypothetical protein QJS10_CPB22g00855 [Acorus calamus]|uniref:RNase H type-1 domain-containing protein n=1 Tax=Acorus calamus TaxID=4465 RepID=A0AAV9BYL6_ACOCL|nr:hypothetical protein QJS10_CPB22g00855 [Acorus calamus]
MGWIKANSDGSVSDDRYGFGVIVRGPSGDCKQTIAARSRAASIDILELKVEKESQPRGPLDPNVPLIAEKKMRKGKTFLLLSMLMFFNLVITPTMASRGIPTDAKPVEKESQVADAGGGAANGGCGSDHGPSITGPSHRTVRCDSHRPLDAVDP